MNGSGREILASKRRALELRARVFQLIRDFFESEGFLEVQTPILTDAPAPEEHIRPIAAESGKYLTTSPELYLKRMLSAGYQKIFQMGPAFRAGERGRLHHPEFTILEWYRLSADYNVLRDDCQRLVRYVCGSMADDCFPKRGTILLDPGGSWGRISVREAFMKFAGWDPVFRSDPYRFDADLVEKVEPHLGFPSPCTLEDYPAEMAALARLKPTNSEVAERFELYWAGIELANAFSELTDPAEQRERFKTAIDHIHATRGFRPRMPETFLESLEHLGPCAGIAFGVDRFVLLLAGADDLDSVVAFPPEQG